jgi:hypothetical protein
LKSMQSRLETVENTSLQSRLEALGQAPSKKTLSDLAAQGQTSFSLAKHLIPLTQLKSRMEAAEAGLEVMGAKVDEANARLAETTRVLHETLEAALKKMVTKEEFAVLEAKHNKLQEQVDKMEKDLVERLERMIREVQLQVRVSCRVVVVATLCCVVLCCVVLCCVVLCCVVLCCVVLCCVVLCCVFFCCEHSRLTRGLLSVAGRRCCAAGHRHRTGH